MAVRVAGFSPSSSGFHFANAFPHAPLREISVPGIGSIPIGDAANGLCGGMSYTVGDLWTAHVAPPPDTSPPAADSPAFEYIVDRQLDSFADGQVPFRFYELMSPTRPDREPAWADLLGHLSIDQHSRTYVMVHEEWPAIKADLDAGSLSMLGLIRVVSLDPRQLGHNHQVAAYGYDLSGTSLTLSICDPNWPNDDAVTISLDVGDPMGVATPVYSTGEPLFCFFRTPYVARVPDAFETATPAAPTATAAGTSAGPAARIPA